MDLASHFRVIAQNWLRILIISAVLGAVIFLASSLQSETYQASETLAVKPGNLNNGQTEAEAATFLAQTYAKYVDARFVLEPALRASKLKISLSEMKSRVSAAPSGDLGFLDVSATGPSPKEAEALARATAAQLIITVNDIGDQAHADLLGPITVERGQIQQQLATLSATAPERAGLELRLGQLAVSESDALRLPVDKLRGFLGTAVASQDPISPKPARDAILGFLIALVAVSELTVLAHFVGDRFSGAEDSADVATLTGLPVLAKIPKGEGIEVIEAFRVLRTNLMVLEGAGKPRTVAIVSANQGAGKTFTATHLAESAATLEEKVVLVDADLRKPTVHERLGIPRAPGLSSVLQGGDLTAALTKVPDSAYLRLLPSGAAVLDPSGMLGARSFRHVLDALRAVRLVIVDTPPAGLFADAMAVASQCDATIFVLDVKTSRRRAVRQSLESLERAGANLIGVVINRASVQKTASYYDG
jgi:capsular exopolysaccharide family